MEAVADRAQRHFSGAGPDRVIVLVDLWAPRCGPYVSIVRILERLSRDRAGRLKVVKVNVDDGPDLQSRFNAMSIPTMLVLRDGKETARQIGALSQRDLQLWVDKHTA